MSKSADGSQVVCIYHGNCADGFAAACIVRRFFGPSVTFHPGVYGEPPPDTTGKHVYIVDFSYDYETIAEIGRRSLTVTVLDHHKTAAEALGRFAPFSTDAIEDGSFGMQWSMAMTDAQMQGAPQIATCFDMNRSGAMITWNYFFPEREPPALIKHVEDRDLWRFALPNTREIQSALFSYPYDFDIWTRFIFGNFVDELASDGKAIERKHHKDVAELVGVCARLMTIGGVEIPVASLPYTLVSDAAHEMALGQPFAACYWDTPMHRIFGLRSTDDGADVSAIAKQYGGGGHAHAAGFRVPRDHELAQA